MQQLCTGAARRKFFIGFTHVAAARGGKGDDCFTLQIIAFQKCIDDRRSNIPPDRESDKDGVVFVHVITLGSDGRARGRIAHFDGAAGFLVHPIQIGLAATGSPREILQLGYKIGFINDSEVWLLMLKKRNTSVHIYNEDEIDEMIMLIRDSFIPAFIVLRDMLVKKLDVVESDWV